MTIFEQRGLLTERYYSELITILFLGACKIELNLVLCSFCLLS